MESDSSDHSPAPTTVSERRRAIFERTVTKFASTGIQLHDPQYVALIERWIDGEFAMATAATLWNEIKTRRMRKADNERFDYPALAVSSLPRMTQEQILAEIAKLTE